MAKYIHSMIRVLDEERSVDFYRRCFGLEGDKAHVLACRSLDPGQGMVRGRSNPGGAAREANASVWRVW